MAHPGRKETRHLAAAAAAAAFACVAHDAQALVLGEASVRSSLGAPLDLRVPVMLAAGEWIEPSCFTLAPDGPPNAPRITGGRISVQRSASGTVLRIETSSPVNDANATLAVVASCRGLSAGSRREYAVQLQPGPSQAVAAGQPRAQATSIREIAATLIARIGDTLESIARAIFPDNRSARRSYIEAMRDANPSLARMKDDEPISVGTPVQLPDLRTFARTRPARTTQVARAEEAAPPRAAAAPAPAPPRSTPKSEPTSRPKPAPRSPAPATAAAPAQSAQPAAPRRTRSGEAFVLKLSSSEVDLTPTYSMDERKRAQLRDRQLILNSDDQVAAVLALRHSVKQLENRVAELQLKLASVPTTFPPSKVEAAKAEAAKAEAAKAEAARVEAAKVEAAKVEAAKIEAAKVEAAKAEAAKAEAAKAEAVKAEAARAEAVRAEAAKAEAVRAEAARVEAAKAEAAKAEAAKAEAARAEAAKAEPPPKAQAAAKAQPSPAAVAEKPTARRVVTEEEWFVYGLWMLAVLLLFAAGYLAWKLWARRRGERASAPAEETAAPQAPADDSIVVADEVHVAEPEPQPAHPQYSEDGRRIIDADVALPTRLANDSDDLRRRYIEERFPEVSKGAIVLEDADSVVKGARLFYEDGAIARAVELLQYAIERDPAQLKCWLALFEIFRLERLSGEYATLAQRFKERHGESSYWPKVQYFGREIDGGNALYQEPIVDKFQTIGPAQAKRIAAESSFDPIAENWLGAPMDFENEVLANELRKAVMAEAGITDGDLLPNPMPALRNVEMFTVA